MIKKFLYAGVLISIFLLSCTSKKTGNLRVVTELNVGENQEVKLSNGDIVRLSLLSITEVRDSIRNAIRAAYVKVSVDGEEKILSFGNYNLPVEVGKVQIDCPAIKSLMQNANMDFWGLTKDASFRLWPKGSPFIEPGTFIYPVKQKWFANKTQAGNPPNFGNDPSVKSIYYHAGFDIGSVEGITEVISATDGIVISAHGKVYEPYKDIELRALNAPEGVYVLDNRGWFIRYSHLDSTDAGVIAGEKIKIGQRIGFAGKQGTSGGWCHLHFDIKNKDNPSGKIAFEDAYVYAWEAYMKQYKPALVAVARPHRLVWTGQDAIFDGTKSKSMEGDIKSYEWIFSDGTSANGPVQKKSYDKPGEYAEILKVTDSKGNVDYDIAAVEVVGRNNPVINPYMHANYYPTMGIKAGDAVTFRVRTFFRGPVAGCNTGNEIWNFGDGSPEVSVRSEFDEKKQNSGKYAETVHSFSTPGNYIVSVERTNECGFHIGTKLHIEVKK
jgi:murein DD-endopeptidase MepM/ murein hydrolase activator NlpD